MRNIIVLVFAFASSFTQSAGLINDNNVLFYVLFLQTGAHT